MSLIKERELKAEIRDKGAVAVAKRLKEALESGHLHHTDFSSIKTIYENFVTEKGKDKESVGKYVLQESELSEESGSVVSSDAFNIVSSQLFFNALTTRYNASDFNVAPLFRVIPSNIVRGDTFAGISNLNTALQPIPEGRQFPSLEPTQDYSKAPAQRQQGACIDITIQMMRSDMTGEIMNMFQELGSALATARELEAVSTLADVGESSPRTRYNWKDTTYATYQSSTPWVNVVGSNGLVNYENINAAYQAIQNILDPFTGLPIATPPGRMKLIVCPELLFMAQRLARGIQYRTVAATANTNTAPLVITDGTPPVEFDVVSSKYLKYTLDQASAPTTTWFMCYPDLAFSWQQMQSMTVGEALPNAGDLFRRNLAASYKAFKIESSYAFNPRYSVKCTVA